jgi:prefoldin alpha subunit
MTEEKTVRLTGNQILQLLAQEQEKLQQINSTLATYQNMKNELISAKDSLNEIAKAKKGTKMLITIGAGILVNATIDETEKAISPIAGNVFKEKKIPELIKTLETRIMEVDKEIEKKANEQIRTIERANKLENILNAGRKALQQQK